MTGGVTEQLDRQELRYARRRRQRRSVAALLGLAALLTLGLTWYLAASDRFGTTPPPRTLLLQLQQGNGAALASALLRQDLVVVVPSGLIVGLPGAGEVPYGEVLRTRPPEASRTALAQALGVGVDDGWVLTLPTLGRLVDQVGGLEVPVRTPVVIGRRVVVPVGDQRLNGDQVGYYLGYPGAGEDGSERVQAVLRALLARLPDDDAAVAQLLAGLGPGSVRTQAGPELAEGLTRLAGADPEYAVLSTVAGADRTALRLDAERARRLLAPASEP